MARLLALGGLMLALGLTPGAAAAHGASDADSTFQQGRALLTEGRYAEACESFNQSQKLDPASGTLLALAYCQELSGLLASAWTNYRAAAELAQKEGHLERRDAAAGQLHGLSDRLSFLTLLVPSGLAKQPGLKVTRDGVEVPPNQFGTAIPVDGGTYRIEASLPDRGTWSAAVTLSGERDRKAILIELNPPPPGVQASAVSAHSTQTAPGEQPPASSTSRTLEYVSLGTGIASVAAFGLGIGFGLSASSKNKDSNAHCDATGCDPQGMELRNDALSAASASTWSFVVGGVLAASSIAVYIGSKNTSKKSATRVDITATPELAGLSVTEAF